MRVDQAERFFRTLGQIPQDGQFFEMTDDNGKRAVYQLLEFRVITIFPIVTTGNDLLGQNRGLNILTQMVIIIVRQ